MFVIFWAVPGLCHAGQPSLQAQARSLAHYIMAAGADINDDSVQALKEYKRSVAYNPAACTPRLKLGVSYLRLDRFDAAMAQFKTVARLCPNAPEAHYMLALLYSSQHQYGLATQEYETILKTAARDNPADTDVYLYLGELYYAQQEYPEAIVQFDKMLQINPRDTSALYLLGSVYADENDDPKAIDVFRRLLLIEPDNGDALNSLGYVYAEQGVHLNEAIRMIRRAIAIDPASGAYYDSLGWALFKQRKYEASLAALKKAGSLIENETLYDHTGDVYKALKEYAEACRYWQKSLDLDPGQPVIQRKIKELKKCLTSRSIHRQK
ncbi:MAG: tetratricopeptide repeat protein [Candidatus Omnitrophica bacterium]|nr:tetratricopeptide repeat protein [Candidatus Omnitrophota bacterium]